MDRTLRRTILSRYRSAGLAARLHARLRLMLCPLQRVEELLPRAGRILDFGCGLGVLTNLLALQSAGRTITAVDVDERKIRAARLTRPEGGAVEFAVAAPGAFPAGPFDAVVISDVLYLVPFERQEAIVRAAWEALAPGGLLVIKEIGTRPRWKYLVNMIEETLTVKILGITRGGRFYFRDEQGYAALLAAAGFRAAAERVDRHYPHPHIIYTGRKP